MVMVQYRSLYSADLHTVKLVLMRFFFQTALCMSRFAQFEFTISAVLKYVLDTSPHYSRTYCSRSSSAKQRWWSIGHLLFFMGDKKAFLEFPWRIIHLFPFSCLASTVQRTTK